MYLVALMNGMALPWRCVAAGFQAAEDDEAVQLARPTVRVQQMEMARSC